MLLISNATNVNLLPQISCGVYISHISFIIKVFVDIMFVTCKKDLDGA